MIPRSIHSLIFGFEGIIYDSKAQKIRADMRIVLRELKQQAIPLFVFVPDALREEAQGLMVYIDLILEDGEGQVALLRQLESCLPECLFTVIAFEGSPLLAAAQECQMKTLAVDRQGRKGELTVDNLGDIKMYF